MANSNKTISRILIDGKYYDIEDKVARNNNSFDSSIIGAKNGIAGLDGEGKVFKENLPSLTTDQIIEALGYTPGSSDSDTTYKLVQDGDNYYLEDSNGNRVSSFKVPSVDIKGDDSGYLMSQEDKDKLNSIASGANQYSLPVAKENILGGVRSGGDVSIDENGVISVRNNSHAHTIDNVTDLRSTLDAKMSKSDFDTELAKIRGVGGGLATLDSTGKVTSSQLPGSVSEIYEGYIVNNNESFYLELDSSGNPVASSYRKGESSNLYINKTNQQTYRWSGSKYVAISSSIVLGNNEETAFRGDLGQIAYNHAINKGIELAEQSLYFIKTNSEGHITSAKKATQQDLINLGLKGDTGVSATGTIRYFLASDKNTGITREGTSGWTTDGVGESSKLNQSVRYLWCYDVQTFSDKSEKAGDAYIATYYGKDGAKGDTGARGEKGEAGEQGDAGPQGKQGEKGDTGAGIQSVVDRYCVTTTNDKTPDYSEFIYTIPPKMDASNRFLWNYEVTIDTNDNEISRTTPTLIGVYGEKGDKGDPGASIGEIVEYYAKWNSSTSAPADNATDSNGDPIWSTKIPQLDSSNKYLWNYEVNVLDNNEKTKLPTQKKVVAMYSSDGKGISEIKNFYIASMSGSQVPALTDSGWTEDVDATSAKISQNKRFLWNYEKIIYTSGEPATTRPCVIGTFGEKGETGEKGADGKDGKDGTNGRGISRIVEEYGVSNSIATAPKEWTTSSADALNKFNNNNKYLWNREKTYFKGADGNEETTPEIGGSKVVGTFSKDGKGIAAITNYYLACNKESGITKDTPEYKDAWTDTPQSVSLEKKYLWNYEVIEYTEGNPLTSDPTVIGAYGDKGDKGDKGDTGRGIKETQEYYAVSESSTLYPDVTSSEWKTDITDVTLNSKNRFLWNYEITIYTDKTNTTTNPKIISIYSEDGRSLVEVVNYYLTTPATSNVSNIGVSDSNLNGWSKTPLSVSVDKPYLWNFEVMRFDKADDKGNFTITTDPCIIGAYGKDGKSGVGIREIIEYYITSEDNKTAPDPKTVTYLEQPQTTSESKPYLWNYEVIVYTDDTTDKPHRISTNSRVISNYSKDGRGIISVTNYYCVSPESELDKVLEEKPKGGNKWTIEPPVTTPRDKYLWNFERIKYNKVDDNGNTEEDTEPCIVGVYGDEGRSIVSVTNYYLVSDKSSGITNENGKWSSDSLLPTEEKPYLWTYEETKFSKSLDPDNPDDVIVKAIPHIAAIRGEKGIQGPPGLDGRSTYFHVKYSEVENPNNDQMTEIVSKYIGTYVDYEQLDSPYSTRYTWVQFLGNDGADGVPGTAGKDGETYYFHVAYADDENGATGFTTGNDATNKAYIGQYVDTVQKDSDDRTRYTWTRIKGEKGDTGATGPQGPQGDNGKDAAVQSLTAPEDKSYLWFNLSNNTLNRYNKETGKWEVAENNTEHLANYVKEQLKYTFNDNITNENSIWSQVTATYNKIIDNKVDEKIGAVKQTLGKEVSELSAKVSQSAKDIDFTFQRSEKLTEDLGIATKSLAEYENHITFSEEGITLKNSNSSILLKIGNDKIAFCQSENGEEIAYFTNNKLFIKNGEFVQTLQLGLFAFAPRSNGNLSFRKIKN